MDKYFEKAIASYVDALVVDEKGKHIPHLVPFHAHADHLRTEVTSALHEFEKSYQRGFVNICQRLTPVELEKISYDCVDQEELEQALLAGAPMYKALGLSVEALMILYKTSCQMIHEKQYEIAVDAFYFLVLLKADTPQFWIGLGLAYAALGQDESTRACYTHALSLQPAGAAVETPSKKFAGIANSIQSGL